jgi:hypothetical protein
VLEEDLEDTKEGIRTRKSKIPKRESEPVNRRTDNSIAKRKRSKGETTIYNTLHRKLRSSNTNPTKKKIE